MADDARTFLYTLFDEAPPSLYFYLWTLPDKVSRFFPTTEVDAAVDLIASELIERDTYVGVGLATNRRAPNRRLSTRQVSAIVGLWADVDFADEAHAQKSYPPDEVAARAVLDRGGVAPSLLVHSGHGLQAWWLFKESWIFADERERSAASQLAARWNGTLRVRAAEDGYVLDSTQDLARVMRVPGTTNRKSKPVLPTVLLDKSGARYDPSEFETYLVDDEALMTLTGRRQATMPHGLALAADARPPFERWEALRENDRKFAQSWDRTRSDLPDRSASAYDLSLASIASMAGWSDQEITDLLIAARRKHGDDLKLREDYYARTIAKAREGGRVSVPTIEMEGLRDSIEHSSIVGDASTAERSRRQLTDIVADAFGIEVTRFVRFDEDPPRFRMETPIGSITIGTAEALLNQRKMAAVVAGATSHAIRPFKSAEWHDLTQAMLSACETVSTGEESRDEGIAYAWLTEYLADRPVLNGDRQEAVNTRSPFAEGGTTYIFGPALRRWINNQRGERGVDSKRMGEVLRSIGCEPHTIATHVGGKRSTRYVWAIPPGVVD